MLENGITHPSKASPSLKSEDKGKSQTEKISTNLKPVTNTKHRKGKILLLLYSLFLCLSILSFFLINTIY